MHPMSQGNPEPQQQPGQARMPQQQGPFRYTPPPSSQSLNQPGPQLLQAQPQNSPQAVGQLTSAPQSNQPGHSSEAEKRKLIQQQLALLLHAHKCQKREQEQQNGTGGQQRSCALPQCRTMKNVLNHIAICMRNTQCKVAHCQSSKRILNHWDNCNDPACQICLPFKKNPERRQQDPQQAQIPNSQLPNREARYIGFQKSYEAHVALGIPFNNLNFTSALFRQIIEGIPSYSQSLNQPQNSLQAVGQLTSASQSNHSGYPQPHPTQFSQTVDFQKIHLALGMPLNNPSCTSQASEQIPGRLAGFKQVQGKPFEPIQAKDWHASVPIELRNHLIQKIIQSIIPNPDPSIFKDDRMVTLVGCARKVEGDIYQKADSRGEYYHLLAEKIAKIQKIYYC